MAIKPEDVKLQNGQRAPLNRTGDSGKRPRRFVHEALAKALGSFVPCAGWRR